MKKGKYQIKKYQLHFPVLFKLLCQTMHKYIINYKDHLRCHPTIMAFHEG